MATAQSGPRGQAPGERAGCKRAGVLQLGRELFPERGEGCWEAWEVSCGVRKEAHIGAAALAGAPGSEAAGRRVWRAPLRSQSASPS